MREILIRGGKMTLSIDLPADTQSEFATIARAKNTTKELLIKEAIIEMIEDFKDAKDADDAHKEFMQDREIIAAEVLYKDLGLKWNLPIQKNL